jgi:hypothetical protein
MQIYLICRNYRLSPHWNLLSISIKVFRGLHLRYDCNWCRINWILRASFSVFGLNFLSAFISAHWHFNLRRGNPILCISNRIRLNLCYEPFLRASRRNIVSMALFSFSLQDKLQAL